MKLYTLTPHESRMCHIDFDVKRLRSLVMVNYKWLLDYNWLCNQPMIMKLYTHTPYESRMCPIDFEVKGQGNGTIMIESGFQTITDHVIHN